LLPAQPETTPDVGTGPPPADKAEDATLVALQDTNELTANLLDSWEVAKDRMLQIHWSGQEPPRVALFPEGRSGTAAAPSVASPASVQSPDDHDATAPKSLGVDNDTGAHQLSPHDASGGPAQGMFLDDSRATLAPPVAPMAQPTALAATQPLVTPAAAFPAPPLPTGGDVKATLQTAAPDAEMQAITATTLSEAEAVVRVDPSSGAGSEMRDTSLRAAVPTVAPAQGQQPYTSQIAETLRSSVAGAANGQGSVELVLSPQELGSVRMVFSNTEAGLFVQIAAERPETNDLLRRNADLFLRDLRDAGHEAVTLDFSTGQDNQSRSSRQEKAVEGFAVSSDAAARIPPPYALAPTPDRAFGRLDLRF